MKLFKISDKNKSKSKEVKDVMEAFFAIHMGDKKDFKECLRKDINLDLADDNGYTLLHFAVINEQLAMVIILLMSGANPNIADNQGNTPLHLAISYGLNQIIFILSKHGAKTNLINKNYETPLSLANTIGRGNLFLH